VQATTTMRYLRNHEHHLVAKVSGVPLPAVDRIPISQITRRFRNAYAKEDCELPGRDFAAGSGNETAIDWNQLQADTTDLRTRVAV